MRLILASASPQRRAILEQLGVEFDVRPSGVEEVEAGEPEAVAMENARRKVAATGGEHVLGVDTIVCLDGRIYGKPADEDEARATLRALSGRTHTVISGIALDDQVRAAHTEVTFRDVEPYLDDYLASGEWRDRAGGYAIQGRGAVFVTCIEGDYFNVVGLPVATLVEMVATLG